MQELKCKIKEVLSTGVQEILPNKRRLERLLQKRKIKVYLGIDPTAPKLHLGHTIGLNKLQQFADLGHTAILVIGTGTVLAGDPCLREKARPKITEKEIKENIKTWRKQAKKILDFSKVKIRYNGDWLLKLRLKDIIDIARNISAVKLFQRESFQKRIKKGDTVWMHETFYPLLQGYDSVVLDVDLEIGGTDQIFNMLIGRELQKKINNREKFIITYSMISGTDGKQMSKSSGNCLWILDSPKEIYGKIMSMKDEIMLDYFELLTKLSQKEILKIKDRLKRGINPKKIKERLAFEIVKLYHSEKEAKMVQKEFNRIFKEKKLPSRIKEVSIKHKELPLPVLLVKIRLTSSKTQAKNLIKQKGVKIDGRVITDWSKPIKIKKGLIVQIGKRKIIKIV